MPKWEYKKINILEDKENLLEILENTYDSIKREEVLEEINSLLLAKQDKLKEQGWRLTTITTDKHNTEIYFRRTIDE